MKNNKVYMPVDAIERHENFEIFYPDGVTCMRFESDWENEESVITIFGRLGGEAGSIKPDIHNITYYIKLERYEYRFRTIRIFKHYYVKGMLWDIYGTLQKPPFDFYYEGRDAKNDVHIKLMDVPGRGPCYEIKVADVAKLRVACAAVVAMAIKEHYRGLSEGEKDPHARWTTKLKNRLIERGKTIEDLEYEERVQEARASIVAEMARNHPDAKKKHHKKK